MIHDNFKSQCDLLREVRKLVAKKYDIQMDFVECEHQVCSSGTCPLCEAEVERLSFLLESKGVELMQDQSILEEAKISVKKKKEESVIKTDEDLTEKRRQLKEQLLSAGKIRFEDRHEDNSNIIIPPFRGLC